MLSEQFTQQTSTHLPAYSHLGAEGMASNPHEPSVSSPKELTNKINIQQFFWEFMDDPVEKLRLRQSFKVRLRLN